MVATEFAGGKNESYDNAGVDLEIGMDIEPQLPPVAFVPPEQPDTYGSLVSVMPTSDPPASFQNYKTESCWSTTLQVSVPFFIAGIGTIGAGLMLGMVSQWEVFKEVSELFILVPALLGLKGNLDMCLASRLSTQVNIGNMVSAKDIWSQILGNIALVQVQSIIAAFIVAIFAVCIGIVMNGSFEWKHGLLLAAAGIITATTSCFVLDFVMIAVIMISHKLRVNPDNIATPLAASFGDVVSITVLANVAKFLFKYHDSLLYVTPGILVSYLLFLPLWIYIVIKQKHTKHVLTTGWTPVLSALFISGLGGLVLGSVATLFPGFVVFQPIINGIGGNLVSVQASRISTFLHKTVHLGELPSYATKLIISPIAVLFHGTPQAKIARILLFMAIPGHLIFAYVADYIFNGQSTVSVIFMVTYLFVSVLQVAILLYCAHILVHFVWRRKIDPDSSTIPYLTALGDLLGSGILALAFLFLRSIHPVWLQNHSRKNFSDSSLQWGTYEFGSDMPPKGANKKGGRHRKGRKNMASLNGGGGEDEVSLMAAADLELEEDFQVQHEPKRKKSQAIPAARHKFEPEENAFSIAVQVFIPFLVAGLGMVGAGLVLDIVQHWEVFRVVSEVFILVPALLGLKGNLEMTLASRLSTQANLGYMDTPKQQWSLIVGNLSLIQCQAIVVGFLASMAAMIMGWIPEGKFDIDHGLLLCASSLVTASLASFVLGIVMIAVIIASRKFNINPDNVATPIAASMGDLITLTLLAWISSLLFEAIETQPWLAPLIIGFCLLLTPIWAWLCRQNKHTKEVLSSGWTPVVLAMGIAVFQPVINGVGGNLVAVQASRISTSLHRDSKIGTLPSYASNICLSPFAVFGAKGGHARTARILLAMVIPGHLIFSYTISYLQAGHTSLTPIFVVVYLLAALIQVSLLLYMSHVMVHWMWSKRIDPDNSAIPYLTAFGDLVGTGLLAIAFQFLYVIGDRDSDRIGLSKGGCIVQGMPRSGLELPIVDHNTNTHPKTSFIASCVFSDGPVL
ncbi:Hypothetical predicted protein [Cloeon dipterum]|uniref:SLC41A/MgtE integral membrane domain-containing protein n=1 Tax=Cloeon dipterum TaxID=197152 RepID=A0A8S1DHE7_9INSE|nr:Hypothetical predicted protein [Cloeon dipterum]